MSPSSAKLESVPKVNRWANYFSLFGSLGTLVCCALPSLFVAVGMGATFASMVSAFPQLVWISKYKNELFLITGILLSFAGVLQWRARNLPCPIDPELARSCTRARRISVVIYTFALFVYLVGGVFAFVLPALLL